MDITSKSAFGLSAQQVGELERMFLAQDQVDCPVINHFGAGVWIREVTIPTGVFAIGHEQRFPQMNIVLRGSVAMYKNGQVEVVKAPAIFTGSPGRKIGFVIEEVTWLNVYPTGSTDVSALEEEFFIKSDDFQSVLDAEFLVEWVERKVDRDDFFSALESVGLDPALVRAQTEDDSDLIPTPAPWNSFTRIDRSPIEGKGLFSTIGVHAGDVIAPAALGGFRTNASRHVNHSKTPSARIEEMPNGDVYLIAIRNIPGMRGGKPGGEVTIDYRTVFARRGLNGE